jgi:hypothetical protein
LTAWSAGIFMATSLVLSLMASSGSTGRGSVLDAVPAGPQSSAPAPAPTAPANPAPGAPAPKPPAPAPATPPPAPPK